MCIHWTIPEISIPYTVQWMAFQNFKGKGGSLNWKSEGLRGILTIGIPKAGGRLETDKSVFLKNVYLIVRLIQLAN